MMAIFWTLLILILTLIEGTWSTTQSTEEMPMTKSLGYLSDGDIRKNQRYMEMYKDVMRASKESADMFDELEEQKLEEIVGRERLNFMKKGILERRRQASVVSSEVARRRERCQNKRRDKLNSQSLRSHQYHIKKIRDQNDSAEEQP